MSVFQLYIRVDNDAFVPDPGAEVARLLREIAGGIERDGCPRWFRTIHDANGNDVGRFAMKETP